jgi:hypothetical protein
VTVCDCVCVCVQYQLRGAQGCLQIEGTFLDTAAGMLPHKVVPEPFPVIVMELLTGGACSAVQCSAVVE